jgi:hypothetical protein
MNLATTQLKDTYGNLVTTGTSAGSPTTGGLQNGDGQLLTSIGIGTNSPTNTLSVFSSGASAITIVDVVGGSSGAGVLQLSAGTTLGSASFDIVQNSAGAFINQRDNNPMSFYVNNDEKIRIEADGDIAFYDDANNQGLFWDASTARLGLGTTSPNNPLTIDVGTGATDGLYIYGVGGSKPTIYLGHDGTHGTDATIQSDGSDGNLKITPRASFDTIFTSGSVGIGNTSPSSYGKTTIALGAVGGNVLALQKDSGAGIAFYGASFNNTGLLESQSANGDMVFYTGTSGVSERLRIDSSGNVQLASSEQAIQWASGNGIVQAPTNLYIRTSSSGGNLLFQVNNDEKMRIDSSGSLLVGKTASGLATTGFQAIKSGQSAFVSDGDRSLILNRKTSDGSILEFRKDESEVGSIGTEGGDMAIGNGDAGLQFIDGTQSVRPFNMTTNARLDAQVDLGMSNTRFKDLYLSGNVILASGQGIDFSATADGSGTMTSELLDDYEEGTWTPAWSFATSGSATISIDSATYTKIGRVVNVNARIFTSSISSPVGTATLTGLPFTANSTIYDVPGSVSELLRWATDIQNLKVFVINNQSYLEMTFNSATDTNATNLSGSDFESGASKNIMSISVTYFV